MTKKTISPALLPEPIQLDEHEKALITYIRSLSWEIVLEAGDGMLDQARESELIAFREYKRGNHTSSQGFEDRANMVRKLAELTGAANAEYRANMAAEDGDANDRKAI
ncbi:hypothetical protein FHS16_001756 [Paenibacillus endophyticus]|uniref:Uncharacterized protein n=1 Tax=Paenibacillus endophyticus TaxID=1294268 RepID=A0A7W5C6M2_9BACL|nr:hypothetical protein [Paenibacillus endophyticus]MBB3151710.1 hypothetical protein [Paenibacillus endophyticus]